MIGLDMIVEPTHSGQSVARFATTLWPVVMNAVDPTSPNAKAALERLCQDYWPPLCAYALHRGSDLHTAQDLTQAFFAHLLERGYLRAADRSRGRFRTFLLTCFQHFLIHEWEKTRAEKRGGNFKIVSWEEHGLGLASRVLSSPEMKPELHYDREWAMALMGRALVRLRKEYDHLGFQRQFEVLAKFLHGEPKPGEYQELAGVLSASDRVVRLTVHRMRRRFGRFVREEVRETVATEADAEAELRHLVEIMSM